MPRRILQSASHAVRGLLFTIRAERNFRLFLSVFCLIVALGTFVALNAIEWLFLLLSGGTFLSIELINTALERLADSVDDHCKHEHQSHCFTALRHAKDIAAAASLVSLVVFAVAIFTVFLTHLRLFL